MISRQSKWCTHNHDTAVLIVCMLMSYYLGKCLRTNLQQKWLATVVIAGKFGWENV